MLSDSTEQRGGMRGIFNDSQGPATDEERRGRGGGGGVILSRAVADDFFFSCHDQSSTKAFEKFCSFKKPFELYNR